MISPAPAMTSTALLNPSAIVLPRSSQSEGSSGLKPMFTSLQEIDLRRRIGRTDRSFARVNCGCAAHFGLGAWGQFFWRTRLVVELLPGLCVLLPHLNRGHACPSLECAMERAHFG